MSENKGSYARLGCGCFFLATLLLLCLLGFLWKLHWVNRSAPQTPFVTSRATFAPSPSGKVQKQPTLTPTALPVMSEVAITQKVLSKREAPINDPIALARRLWHKRAVWATPASPPRYEVGAQAHFWVQNADTNKVFRVQATLVAVRPHVYLWIEDGVRYDEGDAVALARTFETKIYPTDRAFFGSEWTPGIDGDPHIYIVYTRGLGSTIAGYFSSADEVPPFAHKFSNAHEMFVLNADTVNLNSNFTYGVLAHEFQHMIHWYHDRNETSWLNEGASQLASLLNNYAPGGFDATYAANPDVQLNAWADPALHQSTAPHYGASFLFLVYFLGRFGEQATRTLVARPENGLPSVDLTLREINAHESADDLFVDWALANYLQDPSLEHGRYSYLFTYRPPKFKAGANVSTCPASGEDTVHQYGVDYIKITCPGEHKITFQGNDLVSLFPANPHSGNFVFWSGHGDNSDMSLTRKFDLSGVSSASLSYWVWYDIEKDYDFLYVEASRDGVFWDMLKTPSGTDANPTGNNYGWGYTGISGGSKEPRWIHESVDLTPYAGGKVWLRFEYVTDAEINHTGVLIDDISIPQIGYSVDLESGASGWKGRGFVRVGRFIPQKFRVELVLRGKNGLQVRPLRFDARNRAVISFGLEPSESAVLVVSGVSRGTHELARYSWDVR